MTKITLIMVVNSDFFPKRQIQSLLNNSMYDFELIFIKNSSNIQYDDISTDDSRIIIKEPRDKNMSQLLNESIQEATGNYIIFSNSLNILLDDTIKRGYNESDENNANMVMFNQNTTETTKISRIVRNRTFDYNKIREFLFSIDFSLQNFLYKKSFLIRKHIFFNEEKKPNFDYFTYDCILKAEEIFFFNKELNNQKTKNNGFEEFIDSFEDFQKLFYKENDVVLKQDVNNYLIEKSIEKYNKTEISVKKSSFELLRNKFIKILKSKDSEKFIETLNDMNRKLFEQVIISESVEEYELLKQVSEDKKYVNYMKRYEKILNVEYKKISNFNKSLTSSNSWKLTRFLRIRNKL